MKFSSLSEEEKMEKCVKTFTHQFRLGKVKRTAKRIAVCQDKLSVHESTSEMDEDEKLEFRKCIVHQKYKQYCDATCKAELDLPYNWMDDWKLKTKGLGCAAKCYKHKKVIATLRKQISSLKDQAEVF